MKKIFLFLITILMCMSHLQAVSAEEETSGECGDHVTWNLKDGVFTVSGTGPMYDYSYTGVPWYSYYLTIKEVVIEDGVTRIGDNAFFNCQSIEKVTIADSVQSIGVEAFYCARPLQEVKLPEGLERIEENTFGGCNNLHYVYFPDSLTYIGDSAFSVCDLYELNLPENLEEIGYKAFADNDHLKEVVIPDSVTTCWSSAFERCSGLEKVTLSANMTKIPDSMFSICPSLKEIEIPEGISEIGNSAFSACDNLEKVVIADTVTKIGDSAFNNCKKLKDLTLPEDEIEIGAGAFYGCVSLADASGMVIVQNTVYQYTGSSKEVVIPDDVTSISYNAFYQTDIDKVTIPASVTEIGEYAFAYSKVKEVVFVQGLKTIEANAFTESALTKLDLPDSIESIGDYAFSYCDDLAEVNIPETAEIGSGLFLGCPSLADADGFVIVNTILYGYYGDSADLYVPEGVTEIAFMALSQDRTVKEIHFPDSLQKIDNRAFFGSALQKTVIPGSVKEINNEAFRESALQEIVLEEGVESIGNLVFEYCRSLQKVTLPQGLESVGDYAFVNCYSLKEMVVPASVTKIGNRAIGCSGTVIYASPVDGFIIYGKKNSAAQRYANSWGITFVDNAGEDTPIIEPGELQIDFYYSDFGFDLTGSIKEGETIELPHAWISEDGNPPYILYDEADSISIESSDPSIAVTDIDENTLTGIQAGVCYIVYKVEYEGKKGSAFLTLTVEEESMVYVEGKDPTCTEDGYSGYWTNKNTGDIYLDQYGYTALTEAEIRIPATGHSFGNWITIKEATETEKGTQERTCSVCNEKETKEIPVKEKETILFKDVDDPSKSFYDAVYWAVDQGITNGTSKEPPMFSPYATCTRAQFVTFLWRQQGKPEPKSTGSPFTDVQNKSLSYYKAVLWALENKITTGTSATTFSPSKEVTRGQVATFLYRAAGKPEISGTNPFTDVEEGRSYTEPIIWMVSEGITKGTSATTFSPNANCTRAQTVTFLYRAYGEETYEEQQVIDSVYLERLMNRQGQGYGYPDNSLEGIMKAVEDGYQKIRISIGATNDNVIYCTHAYEMQHNKENNVLKQADEKYTGNININSVNSDLIDSLLYKNYAIPTLNSVLSSIEPYDVEVTLELKNVIKKETAQTIIDTIDQYDVNTIISGSATQLKPFIELDDQLDIAHIFHYTPEGAEYSIQQYAEKCNSLRFDCWYSDDIDVNHITDIIHPDYKIKLGGDDPTKEELFNVVQWCDVVEWGYPLSSLTNQ